MTQEETVIKYKIKGKWTQIVIPEKIEYVDWYTRVKDDKSDLIKRLEAKKGSVDQLREKMGEAYNDLSVQVAYKEGFNRALQDAIDEIRRSKHE